MLHSQYFPHLAWLREVETMNSMTNMVSLHIYRYVCYHIYPTNSYTHSNMGNVTNIVMNVFEKIMLNMLESP